MKNQSILLFNIKLYLRIFLILVCSNSCTGYNDYNESEDYLPLPIVVSDDSAIVPIVRDDTYWIIRHEKILSKLENNAKIIFIGDSITEYWSEDGIDSWHELQSRYTKIINLGISFDRTEHVLWRLTNGEFPDGINPEYVILMIGTNNTGYGNSPESIAAGIGEIIKVINRVSPATKIILFAIFPRGADNSNVYRINNNKVNNIIKTYNGHLNVEYYDIGSYCIEQNGNIKNKLYTGGDLMHLSSAGYILWKNKILELINNL